MPKNELANTYFTPAVCHHGEIPGNDLLLRTSQFVFNVQKNAFYTGTHTKSGACESSSTPW